MSFLGQAGCSWPQSRPSTFPSCWLLCLRQDCAMDMEPTEPMDEDAKTTTTSTSPKASAESSATPSSGPATTSSGKHPAPSPAAAPTTQQSKRKRGPGIVTPNACTECRKKRAKVRSPYPPIQFASVLHIQPLPFTVSCCILHSAELTLLHPDRFSAMARRPARDARPKRTSSASTRYLSGSPRST